MRACFPFVDVPPAFQRVVGEPLPGTRMYRRQGPENHISEWEDAIFAKFGPCVSPGGAAQRAGVSRAAVHDRLKQGKLTGFFFFSTKPRRLLFAKLAAKRKLMVGYIPVSEASAWRRELEERALRKGVVTKEDLENDKPDWSEWFMEWNSKFAKARQKEERQ